MNGGTYAQALKAGFCADKSGFLSRFGAELQGEILVEIARRQVAEVERQATARRTRRRTGVKRAALLILPVLAGFFIGRLTQ